MPDDSQSLKRERDELRLKLQRLSALFRTLLSSRRWRVGNKLGNLAEKVRRVAPGPNPLAEIDSILSPYRTRRPSSPRAEAARGADTDPRGAWLGELCHRLPQLLGSRRWKVGRGLMAPIRKAARGDADTVAEQLWSSVGQGRKLLREKRKLDSRADVLLEDIARSASTLLASREWRIGRWVGDVIERTGIRPGGDKAEDQIGAVLGAYRSWRSGLPGVSADRDREAFNRHYQTYLSQVEPELERDLAEARAPRVSLRIIVLGDQYAAGTAAPHPDLQEIAPVTLCTRAGGEPRPSGIDLLRYQGSEPDLVESLNRSLGTWSEDWLILLRASDRLAAGLPAALGAALARSSDTPAAFVFDHDRIDGRERRSDPVFKPGFSPEWLIEHDYVGRAAAFNRRALLAAGGFEAPLPHAVRATLWKLFSNKERVAKVDRIMLHENAEEPAVATTPEEDADFALWALRHRGLQEQARVLALAHGAEVRFDLPETAMVSIIITFTDKAELLRQCVESVRRLTTHPRYELVLVNTRSLEEETRRYLEELQQATDVQVIDLDEKFNFSRANNLGARAARGDYLVFLNNDTKLLTADWLQQLCGYATRSDIGAVGAKLLFADGSLQHAGVVVGMGGFAHHLFSAQHEPFVPPSWVRFTRNCSSVTGACLAIEKSKFLACGGFDERLILTGNDVELCIRLLKQGLRNVFIPTVVLFHFERSTRRHTTIPEHNKRLSHFTYRDLLRHGDPYYNRNLRLDTTEFLPKTQAGSAAGVVSAVIPQVPTPVDHSSPFIQTYDLAHHVLEANRKRMEGFRRDRRVVPETILWFVPHFDHVYRGGLYTIMRIAEHFSRQCGALNRFVFYGRGRGDVEGMSRQIGESFPELRRELLLLKPGEAENHLPASDIAFCTLWTSAYHLARYDRCRGKFYLVQDFEGGFNRENSVSALAEETYRFGFEGVANTPGVCEMYQSYGNEADYFVPAVDRKIFSPADFRLPDDVFRLVVYGRPEKPRNAFGLAAESIRELKRRQGDRVEIISVGADYDVRDYGLEDLVLNLGLLPDLETVAHVYRQSHAGLVFMLSKHPSYQPFEYMASGCAVVTNVNEANAWFFRHRENALLVPPLRTAVVEAIEELMEKPELRAKLVAGGLDTVARTTWEEEMAAVYHFVTTGERRCSLGQPGAVASDREAFS